jgi:uncharacterized protein YbcV (DUF1398 family)
MIFVKNYKPMFTIQEINSAHSKVKSGTDFPAYIRDIKKLGVASYDTFVTDGHTDYHGENDYRVSAPARYAVLAISNEANAQQFKTDLRAHQLGHTGYDAFIGSCAELGIAKWTVSTKDMTCTYYDKKGNIILVEEIPA